MFHVFISANQVNQRFKCVAAQRWNRNVNDIITRDINNLYWAKIWAFSKWQWDVIDDIIVTKIQVFDKKIIYYAD